MIIPDSLIAAYEAEMATIEALVEIASKRLRVLCDAEHWLFDDRVKDIESTVVKLETGRSPSLQALEDVYAAMVVVPTHASVRRAVDLILGRFEGEEKPQRTVDPQAFPYDDVHVIARLGSRVSPAVAVDAVRSRDFEIQVRTGLQYAWWRATHDTTYKGTVRGWGPQRLASQARASLELLDGVLADIPASAALQTVHSPVEEPEPPAAAGWLELWGERDRPDDVARFCETVATLLAAAGLEAGAVGDRLASDDCRPFIGTAELTPLQALVLVIHGMADAGWVGQLLAGGGRILITDEMLRLDDSLREVPIEARVRLK